MTIIELFPDKFIIDPITNCWLYTGPINQGGYGTAMYRGNQLTIHRLSAFLSGLIIDITDSKIYVLHNIECLNKNCGNYEHLHTGNQYDNMQDAIKKGTHVSVIKKGVCKNGHELTDNNVYTTPKSGDRRCLQCKKDARKVYYYNNKVYYTRVKR